MAQTLKVIRACSPTSCTLEREFSALTIILNPRRNRLYCPTLQRILQGRNFQDLKLISDVDRSKLKA